MLKLKISIKEKVTAYIKNNADVLAGGLLALNGNVAAYRAFAMLKGGKQCCMLYNNFIAGH